MNSNGHAIGTLVWRAALALIMVLAGVVWATQASRVESLERSDGQIETEAGVLSIRVTVLETNYTHSVEQRNRIEEKLDHLIEKLEGQP